MHRSCVDIHGSWLSIIGDMPWVKGHGSLGPSDVSESVFRDPVLCRDLFKGSLFKNLVAIFGSTFISLSSFQRSALLKLKYLC